MSREDIEDAIVEAFCEASGRDAMCIRTLKVLRSFAEAHGLAVVLEWIEISAERLDEGTWDGDRGRYISGIRRHWIEEQEAQSQLMCHGDGI